MGIVVAGTSQGCGGDALRYCGLAIGSEAYMLNDEADEYANMQGLGQGVPSRQYPTNIISS